MVYSEYGLEWNEKTSDGCWVKEKKGDNLDSKESHFRDYKESRYQHLFLEPVQKFRQGQLLVALRCLFQCRWQIGSSVYLCG